MYEFHVMRYQQQKTETKNQNLTGKRYEIKFLRILKQLHLIAMMKCKIWSARTWCELIMQVVYGLFIHFDRYRLPIEHVHFNILFLFYSCSFLFSLSGWHQQLQAHETRSCCCFNVVVFRNLKFHTIFFVLSFQFVITAKRKRRMNNRIIGIASQWYSECVKLIKGKCWNILFVLECSFDSIHFKWRINKTKTSISKKKKKNDSTMKNHQILILCALLLLDTRIIHGAIFDFLYNGLFEFWIYYLKQGLINSGYFSDNHISGTLNEIQWQFISGSNENISFYLLVTM